MVEGGYLRLEVWVVHQPPLPPTPTPHLSFLNGGAPIWTSHAACLFLLSSGACDVAPRTLCQRHVALLTVFIQQ